MKEDEDDKVRTNVKLLKRTTWFIIGTMLTFMCIAAYIVFSYKTLNPISWFEVIIYACSILGMICVILSIDIIILIIFDQDRNDRNDDI